MSENLVIAVILTVIMAPWVFSKPAARLAYRLGSGLHEVFSNISFALDKDTCIEESERAARLARERADESERRLEETKRAAGL